MQDQSIEKTFMDIWVKILHFFEVLERYIVIALICFMMLAVFVSTVELGILLYRELMSPPRMLLDIKNLLEIFGFFFMILIGLELLATIKTYLTESQMHVEIVFLVAMIAVARKVIILDWKILPPQTIYGIAAVILSLSAGYYLVKRVHLK